MEIVSEAAIAKRAKILFVCSRKPSALPDGRNDLQERTRMGSSFGRNRRKRAHQSDHRMRWADVIVVMEKRHKERCGEKMPEELARRTM